MYVYVYAYLQTRTPIEELNVSEQKRKAIHELLTEKSGRHSAVGGIAESVVRLRQREHAACNGSADVRGVNRGLFPTLEYLDKKCSACNGTAATQAPKFVRVITATGQPDWYVC